MPEWNYHPELPLQDRSVFQNWKSIRAIAHWFRVNWLSLSEFVLLAIAAVVLWLCCYPSIERANEIRLGWITQILVVNFLLVLTVAGSLHWYFYIRKGQAYRLKFDKRDPIRHNRNYLFSDQVKDNMFWSLTSGVVQLTLFQVVAYWILAQDLLPSIPFLDNPAGLLLGFVFVPLWSAFHFYWIHRLLHVPFMYKRFHSLHHKNVNIGPWSGIAMHPVEHALYISSLCLHWVVYLHPVHLIFHVVWLGPGAAMSHTGYENLLIKDKRRLALGTFYHQLHHRYFECNYGNQEMPWDRWFGTFHDGTDAATVAVRERRRKMYS